VREAGGYVSDFTGRTDNLLTAVTFLAASSRGLLRKMSAALTPA
jgi:fructose-1,6-bisphosphatase/inositol monophosphatase family enzyme